MISKGISTELLSKVSSLSESEIAGKYIGITKIPCTINSPLRRDEHPSFRLFATPEGKVLYKDFSNGDKGTIFQLLEKLWNTDYYGVITRLCEDNFSSEAVELYKTKKVHVFSTKDDDVQLQCKLRNWKQYDIDYWNSYGISLPWLKYAEIYPISHRIVMYGNRKKVYVAEKHAYVFVEHKDGKTTLKIYQPFSTKCKWRSKHDGSVISLWTKIPEKGDILCICSSVKDSLCLWANTGIPAIALQGEGYSIKKKICEILKSRFKRICIFLDNDEPGKAYAKRLSDETGFENITLPDLGAKDISDLYKKLDNKEMFCKTIINLFKTEEK